MDEVALERAALRLFEALSDIAEAEREDWIVARTAGNSALEGRLRSLIAAERRASMRTGGAWQDPDDAPLPERIGAYRITGLIGRGGMGSVYRGERAAGDFEHAVAIKVIKPGLLSEALAERFRNERQTLAQLQHPHIAQLFDGGEMPDGSPYIVMELVAGRSLLDWVNEQRPSPAERLHMFGLICRAVAFAHASLVVHRDLTPSNVLVTAQGHPKLIDFGIARAPDLAATADGSRLPSLNSLSLTPGYAAPERLTSAAVSTGADIYSLGKLLGWLIPRQDVELAAIVSRATAADPQDRYATALALAEDVEAWRSCRPVAAMEGGRRYVAAKFIRRNRLPLGLATLALALLVGALAYALVANHRAQLAQAEAEARFSQTRAIARTLLFDLFDEVSKAPGSTRARQKLAETGATYLDALAALPSAPDDVRLEAGQGFLRLAIVVGGGQAGSLGHYKDGGALLAKSVAILGPLHQSSPDKPDVTAAYVALLLEQSGTNLYNEGKTALARTQAQEARRLITPLAHDGSASHAALYINALQAEGDSFEWDDDYATARRLLEQGEAFAASLPAGVRQAREVMVARSSNLRLLGMAYHKLKQAEPARRVLDQGIAINRELVGAEPDNPSLTRKLVNSLRYAAVVHRTNLRDAEARRAIEEAARHAARMVDRDPSDGGMLHLLGTVQEVQAQILADQRQFAASFAAGDAVIAAHRRIVELASGADGARRSLAAAMRTVGGNHYNGGDYVGACTLWRGALEIYRSLDQRGTLSDSDRKGSMAEMTDYVARACDNGAPPAGLGTEPI